MVNNGLPDWVDYLDNQVWIQPRDLAQNLTDTPICNSDAA